MELLNLKEYVRLHVYLSHILWVLGFYLGSCLMFLKRFYIYQIDDKLSPKFIISALNVTLMEVWNSHFTYTFLNFMAQK